MDDSSSISNLFSAVEVLPLTPSAIIALILAVLSVIASAYFSGSEVAYFSLRPYELEGLKDSDKKTDRSILDILANSEYLLGTILICNNFVNNLITLLLSYVVNNTFDFSHSPLLGFLVQVIGITAILLFFGEIMPKVYFQNHALSFVRRSVSVMDFFVRMLTPLTKGLVKMGTVINKIQKRKEKNVSHEELEKAIELTTESVEEKGLLNEIVRFYQKTVSEVMTPRMEVAALDIDTPFKEVKEFILEKGYSRLPVYNERIDNIVGVLYSKDLLAHLFGSENFEWQKVTRSAFFVPESKRINNLLEEFREQKIHMAIVVDEFGGTSGIVTMEDLLEEIVGEIEDEYDTDDEQLYTLQPDGSYIFDAKISILDFLRTVRINDYHKILEQLDEADTLGGLLLEIKGDFPSVGEVIKLHNHEFKILEMGRRRISKVLFTKAKGEEQPHEDSSENT